jgi:hypothetical protein
MATITYTCVDEEIIKTIMGDMPKPLTIKLGPKEKALKDLDVEVENYRAIVKIYQEKIESVNLEIDRIKDL